MSPSVGTERIVEQITVGQCVYDKIEQDVKGHRESCGVRGGVGRYHFRYH